VHENERRLAQKCRQLNEEIETNVAKVSAVLDMTSAEQIANAEIHQVGYRY